MKKILGLIISAIIVNCTTVRDQRYLHDQHELTPPKNEYEIMGRFNETFKVNYKNLFSGKTSMQIEKDGRWQKFGLSLVTEVQVEKAMTLKHFEKIILTELVYQNKKADRILFPMFFTDCTSVKWWAVLPAYIPWGSTRTCEVNVRGYYAAVGKVKGDIDRYHEGGGTKPPSLMKTIMSLLPI